MAKTKLKDIKIGADGDAPTTMGILSRSKNQSYYQGKTEKPTPEKMVKPGILISRLDQPANVDYGKDVIRLSPRARLKIADMDKIGKLPARVVCVPLKK